MLMLNNEKRQNKPPIFIICISFLLLISIAALPVAASENENVATLRQIGKTFSSISEKASPAVVWVQTERIVTYSQSTSPFGPDFDPFQDDFFDFFFRRQMPGRRYNPPKSRQIAMGSGFIISQDGYIITNIGEAEARQGGRAKKFYRLTKPGLKKLKEIRRLHMLMWKNFDHLAEDTMEG